MNSHIRKNQRFNFIYETEFFLLSSLTWRLPRFLKRRVLSRVDLPAPLAPMMASISPGSTNPLTEHTINMCIIWAWWRCHVGTLFQQPSNWQVISPFWFINRVLKTRLVFIQFILLVILTPPPVTCILRRFSLPFCRICLGGTGLGFNRPQHRFPSLPLKGRYVGK